MGRDTILWTKRFISSSPHYYAATIFPISSPMWHRCQESRLQSLRLLASLHGVGGVSGFWEAPLRLLTGCLLPSTPGVRRSPSMVFVFFLFFLRVDNPTIRMSILSLLFGLISFLLLALDPVNLIQIVVLVLIHISVIHVVSLFLVVRINLCIAKLLLFPTIQKPDRHLAMTKGYTDAMKPEKFTGVNFKRWQTRAQLWLMDGACFGSWVILPHYLSDLRKTRV